MASGIFQWVVERSADIEQGARVVNQAAGIAGVVEDVFSGGSDEQPTSRREEFQLAFGGVEFRAGREAEQPLGSIAGVFGGDGVSPLIIPAAIVLLLFLIK